MVRPRTCECELHTCKTCTQRAHRAAWIAKNPERAKKMALSSAYKRRARTNITEEGRRNAAQRWLRSQDEKPAKLSEWIETEWRPNLPPGHAGRLGA